MYNLFLDDIRMPVDVANYIHTDLRPMYRQLDWIIVRNYNDFVQIIENSGIPRLISFDHDLADEHYAPEEYWDDKYSEWELRAQFKEKTGYDCAKWLLEYCTKMAGSNYSQVLPEILCHSMNPVGKQNILNCFK